MVLSIWHYYVISDQRHTMVSVSELRRRWLITMALSVHTPHQPGHAERWGTVTRYSQIHHQHRTQHPGISHPLTSHTESDPRIYLLSLVISFPPENQFSDYISPVLNRITLYSGETVDLNVRCRLIRYLCSQDSEKVWLRCSVFPIESGINKEVWVTRWQGHITRGIISDFRQPEQLISIEHVHFNFT